MIKKKEVQHRSMLGKKKKSVRIDFDEARRIHIFRPGPIHGQSASHPGSSVCQWPVSLPHSSVSFQTLACRFILPSRRVDWKGVSRVGFPFLGNKTTVSFAGRKWNRNCILSSGHRPRFPICPARTSLDSPYIPPTYGSDEVGH